MPSRDIEKSLREEIEGYVESRLQSVREELARLQEQINQTFASLSERLSAESGTDAPIAVAVAEHLRQARNIGIEEAAEGSVSARSSSDVAILKSSIEDLEERGTQSDVLNTLVNSAASFAPRVAFFVAKNERLTGWRARGLEGTVGDDAVRELSIPLSSDTLLGEAARTRKIWSGEPGSHEGDNLIYKHFGGEPPSRIVAIPLVVRGKAAEGKAVAVLYADSAQQDSDSVNLEALETLVRVAAMSVELLVARRSSSADSQAGARPAAEAEKAYEPSAQQTYENVAQPAYEAATRDHDETASATQEIGEGESAQPFANEPAPEVVSEPEFLEGSSSNASGWEIPSEAGAGASESQPGAFEPLPVEPLPVESSSFDVAPSSSSFETAPAAAAQTDATAAAPRRRYGADAEFPVEVSEEERPVHDRARRFARLLVSEIKLYNEQKVREGCDAGDLYSRLREDIDRSREMYDKRFAEQVGSRYDYFHQELINTLAGGDSSKLGEGYPGASVSA